MIDINDANDKNEGIIDMENKTDYSQISFKKILYQAGLLYVRY